MLVDGLRLFWLPSIAQVSGNPRNGLPEWVGKGQYYFDEAVGPNAASFVVTAGESLLDIFASEMSRFSSAAIETSVGIARSQMRKSTAWLFIQTYYAAFYAAHSILRSAGISASNFRQNDCSRADAIADALGFSKAPLNSAQFRCQFNSTANRLICTKALGGGVHEQFWRIFDNFLTSVPSRILGSTALTAQDAQSIAVTFDHLRSILRHNGHHNGNWLSAMRNEVTYTQQHAAWFPYGRSRAECDRLFELGKEWLNDPEAINLNSAKRSDAELFVITCAFLVSLAISNTRDMALRCSGGNSFLLHGPVRLLNQTPYR